MLKGLCTVYNANKARDLLGPENHVNLIGITNCGNGLTLGNNLGRPRLGQRRSRIELREENYKRWRETKQRLNFSSDNALAVYLLSRCLAQSSGESVEL